jgi:hypothetical protein
MASIEKIEAFLAERCNVVVGGARKDGRRHLSPQFRTLREKHWISIPADEEFLRDLADEGRVLLSITPDKPLSEWTVISLD